MPSSKPRTGLVGKSATRPPGSTRVGSAYVGLLRGINVGGNKRVPMAELRALAERLGCTEVVTYIQSGNLVLQSRLSAPKLESVLSAEIERTFGFPVPVIVRSATEWERYAAGSPFPDSEREHPQLLQLGLSLRPLAPSAAVELRSYAKAGERVAVRAGALWIDFPAGIARSKLTPAALDRAAGSPVTSRNFRSVQQLWELVGALR